MVVELFNSAQTTIAAATERTRLRLDRVGGGAVMISQPLCDGGHEQYSDEAMCEITSTSAIPVCYDDRRLLLRTTV
jgi:hypothetical protein